MQNENITEQDLDFDLDLTLQTLDLPDAADFGFLAHHDCDCEHCTRSHCIYDTIFAAVSALPTFEAPEGFELEVMARLRDMGNGKYALEVRVWDKARNASVGTILLFLGAGSIYAFFRDSVWRILPTPQTALKLASAAKKAPKVSKPSKGVKSVRLSQTAKMTKSVGSTALTTAETFSKLSKLLLGVFAVLTILKECFGNRRKGDET